jgi:hypothetical protein
MTAHTASPLTPFVKDPSMRVDRALDRAAYTCCSNGTSSAELRRNPFVNA